MNKRARISLIVSVFVVLLLCLIFVGGEQELQNKDNWNGIHTNTQEVNGNISLIGRGLKGDLVAYWSFDTDATDDHGSNDGTVFGAEHITSGQKVGAGAYNTTKGYIWIGNLTSALSSTGSYDYAWSISFWMKIDNEPSIAYPFGLGGATNTYGIYAYRDGGTPTNAFGVGTNANFDVSRTYRDIWHHVVITHKEPPTQINYTAYENGTWIRGIKDTGDFTAMENMVVGIRGDNSSAFSGIIDEVAIWKRMIYLEEVEEIWNDGSYLPYTSWNDVGYFTSSGIGNGTYTFNWNEIEWLVEEGELSSMEVSSSDDNTTWSTWTNVTNMVDMGIDEKKYLKYRANFNDSTGNLVYVNISYDRINVAPIFEPINSFSENEDFTTLTLDLSENLTDDLDPDSDLNFTWTNSDTSVVTISSINNGTDVVTFTAVANATGLADINITVWDTEGLQNSTNFTLTINPVNDAPWINTTIDNVTALEDFATFNAIVVADLQANFSDVEEDGAPTTYELITSTNTSTSCYFDGSNNFACLSLANASGTDYYKLSLNDSSGSGIIIDWKIAVTAVDDIPWWDYTITNNTVQITEDTANQNTTNASAYYWDVEDTHTYSSISIITNNSNVSCLESNTKILCSPINNYTGPFIISMSADDGTNPAINMSYEVTVNNVNDQPWIDTLSDPSAQNEDAGTFTAISSATLSTAFRDVEEDQSPTTKTIDSETHTEIVDCLIDTGALSCTTQANQSGTSDVTLKMCDSSTSCATDTVTITINTVNDPPWWDLITNSSLSITEDTDSQNAPVNISIYYWDVEDIHTWSSISVTTNNSNVACANSGVAIQCSPTNNFTGVFISSVTASDGTNPAINLSYEVLVNAVNDAPWINTTIDNVTALEDFATFNAIVVADLNANFSDVEEDGAPTTYELITSTNTSTSCYFDGSNNFACLSLANASGTDYYKLSLNDSSGSGIIIDWKIAVTAVNDDIYWDTIPAQTGTEDIQGEINLSGYAWDVETTKNNFKYNYFFNNTNLVSSITLNNATGNLSWLLVGNASGDVNISTIVYDADGSSAQTEFNLHINSVNDNPWWNEVPNGTVAITEDTANQNVTIDYRQYFRDVEDDLNPTLSIISDNETDITCAMDTGDIECSSSNNYTGQFILTVNGTDSGYLSDITSFEINVTAVDDIPWIETHNITYLNRTGIPQDTVNQSIEIEENETLTFDLLMKDVEDVVFAFKWLVDSVIQAWDSARNWFTYHFGMESAGTYNITGVGNDTGGLEAIYEWEVNVTNIIVLTITNEVYSPSTVYNNDSVYINATITDTNNGGIDTVWIEADYNLTSILMNYTNHSYGFTNDGNVWSYFIDSGNLTNQDNITWTFYANDTNGGEVRGTFNLSFFVTNRPTEIVNVTIEPPTPVDTDDLNCTIESYSDMDGDSITLLYQWYKDTVLQDINIDADNLSSGNLTDGDVWECGVIGYDGIENGTEAKSGQVEIGSSNVKPTIVQSNATTGATNVISDSTNPTNNNTYVHFEVAFTDDGDAIDDSFLLFICNSTSTNSTGGCTHTEYCNNLTNGTEKQLSCNYNIRDSDVNQQYTYYAFVNDNVLSSSYSSGTFDVNHPPYNITLIAPDNNSLQNTQGVYLNYSGTDPDLDDIWFRIYIENATDPSYYGVETTAKYYNFSASELTYNWKIEAYDGHGLYAGELSEIRTFSVDYTPPNNTIEATDYTSTSDGRSAKINIIEASDNTGLESCFYKITSVGGFGNPSDYTLTTCGDNFTLDSTNLLNDDTNYTFYYLINDSYNNQNENSISFVTSTSVPSVPSIGGGGPAAIITLDLGETCSMDSQCKSGICNLEGNEEHELYGKCVTFAQLCGNNYCDEKYGENIENCRRDCTAYAKTIQTYGRMGTFGRGVVWTLGGAVVLFFGWGIIFPKGTKINIPLIKRSIRKIYRRKEKKRI